MAYSLDMRQRALELVKEGKSKTEISRMFGVSCTRGFFLDTILQIGESQSAHHQASTKQISPSQITSAQFDSEQIGSAQVNSSQVQNLLVDPIPLVRIRRTGKIGEKLIYLLLRNLKPMASTIY